jgi:23S rRNA U2552 (ribose-2'-O)-methylase RlmE/FtsJ
LERLLAAHELAMTNKVILCKSLGKSICYLILGVNREDLDKALSNMFTKVMVTNVDVFGSGTAPELSSKTLQ